MFENYKLEILFQDDSIVVINKPSGLLVHKSMLDPHEIYFAVDMLENQIGQKVYSVHRIDRATSGVLLFAKNSECARILSEQFANNTTQKTYLCVVRGYMPSSGIIDYPLSRKLDKIADKDSSKDKDAQEAITHFRTVATSQIPYAVGKYPQSRYSLVEASPRTGRKHQIRRHLKHLSHHLIGDTKYGRGEHNKLFREVFNSHRMLLHAFSLELLHPNTKEQIIFKAPIDDTFTSVFNTLGWEDFIS
jgi:tRNA pseudouridine65 synthase